MEPGFDFLYQPLAILTFLPLHICAAVLFTCIKRYQREGEGAPSRLQNYGTIANDISDEADHFIHLQS